MSAQDIYKDWVLPDSSWRDVDEISNGEYDLPLTFTPERVLDIGAHVGLFTGWARHKWPECRVTAFEPWAENCEMFRKNINGDPRVRLFEEACFHEPTVTITQGKNTYTNTAYPESLGHTTDLKRTVKAQIPEGRYDFIKCDCEGAEAEILSRMDLSETKAIVVEAHTEKIAREIDQLMADRGMTRLLKKYHGFSDVQLLKYSRNGSSKPLPQKVMVCMPIYGDLCGLTAQCVLRLMQAHPLPMMLNNCIGDSLVSRARNTLTHQFMRSDCTDLLFIDSDLVFSADHVARICSHSDLVVGGLYPKKSDTPEVEWVLNAHKDLPGKREDGLQQVSYIGTGFIRVKRAVFEQMIERFGDEMTYKDDSSPSIMHDFWPNGVYRYSDGSKRYLSEDWFFCQRWLDMGGKVFADTKIVLKHIGTAIYPLRCQEKTIIQAPA